MAREGRGREKTVEPSTGIQGMSHCWISRSSRIKLLLKTLFMIHTWAQIWNCLVSFLLLLTATNLRTA